MQLCIFFSWGRYPLLVRNEISFTVKDDPVRLYRYLIKIKFQGVLLQKKRNKEYQVEISNNHTVILSRMSMWVSTKVNNENNSARLIVCFVNKTKWFFLTVFFSYLCYKNNKYYFKKKRKVSMMTFKLHIYFRIQRINNYNLSKYKLEACWFSHV